MTKSSHLAAPGASDFDSYASSLDTGMLCPVYCSRCRRSFGVGETHCPQCERYFVGLATKFQNKMSNAATEISAWNVFCKRSVAEMSIFFHVDFRGSLCSSYTTYEERTQKTKQFLSGLLRLHALGMFDAQLESVLEDANRIASLNPGPLPAAHLLTQECGHFVKRAYILRNYFMAGARDFYIERSLADLLTDTDLNAVCGVDIKLPFECFSLAYHDEISFAFGDGRAHRVLLCDDPEAIRVFQIDVRNGSHRFMQIPKSTEPFLEVLRREIRTDRDGASMEMNEAFYRLAVNTVLYINSPGADVWRDTSKVDKLRSKLANSQNSKKKTRRQKQAEQELRIAESKYIYVVGKSIATDPRMHAEATDTGRRLMKRFRVRGHWRKQVCGPNRCERKLTWIKPYWKGPEMAELVNKGYVVKTPEE